MGLNREKTGKTNTNAFVAELADAHASGACEVTLVQVRSLSKAKTNNGCCKQQCLRSLNDKSCDFEQPLFVLYFER